MIADPAASFTAMQSGSPRLAKKSRATPDSPPSPLSLPVAKALETLADIGEVATRHRLATSLGFHWARHDINHAWCCVNESNLDVATKQLLFNMMMG